MLGGCSLRILTTLILVLRETTCLKTCMEFPKIPKAETFLNKFLGLLLVNLLKRTLGFFHENNAQSFRIVFLKKTWVQLRNFDAISKNTFEWRLRFLAMAMMCEFYYYSARNIPEYGFPLTCTFPNKGCSYSGKYGSEKTPILTFYAVLLPLRLLLTCHQGLFPCHKRSHHILPPESILARSIMLKK